MIKHHWFAFLIGQYSYSKKYTPEWNKGDFHIFIIQHSSQYPKYPLYSCDQPAQFEAWVKDQPLELVYRSPYKIVNYREQKYGPRLELVIYKVKEVE